MIRKIIHIDEEKCNGCGACASACQEGAIAMVDGKARLMRDDYCDGLGNCLPACPTGAITFVEREAAAYDEAAVEKHLKERAEKALGHAKPVHGGCPGMMARAIRRENAPAPAATQEMPSQLSQWPVQIKLAGVAAPYFENADILIAADCTAYAYGNFHADFIRGRITLIGCPKLDAVDYTEKLTAIFASHNIRSVTVARMEVPCCGGIEYAVQNAIAASGKDIPCRVAVIGTDGTILEERVS